MPPAKAVSRLSMERTISIPGASMSERNMVALPSSSLAMMMAKRRLPRR